MPQGLARQPTFADLMEQLSLLSSPRQGLGMSQQALPQPPAPDIGAALQEALGALMRGPGQSLFNDPLAGEDPETRRLIEMSMGGGSSMGLLGKGAGLAKFGPDVMESLGNLARMLYGKQRPPVSKLNPRLWEFVQDAAGESETFQRMLQPQRELTLEGLADLFGKLSPGFQRQVSKQAFREGRQGGVETLSDAVANTLDWRQSSSYPRLFISLIADLLGRGQ